MLNLLLFLPIDNVELAAMVALPALLPDARCKVDISKIIYLAQVCNHCSYMGIALSVAALFCIICLINCTCPYPFALYSYSGFWQT